MIRSSNKPLIALTGGVASGKTAVSNRLAALGAIIIDTDLIAREVVEPGSSGLKQVVTVFGEDVLQPNGGLDRRALRQRIFDSPAARRQLEAIIHPLIKKRAEAMIQAADPERMVVLVVPLLVESGLFGRVDAVVVVDVPEELQVQRLLDRDGSSREDARRMLSAQASRHERLAHADHVIDNSGSLSDLDRQVSTLYRSLMG